MYTHKHCVETVAQLYAETRIVLHICFAYKELCFSLLIEHHRLSQIEDFNCIILFILSAVPHFLTKGKETENCMCYAKVYKILLVLCGHGSTDFHKFS